MFDLILENIKNVAIGEGLFIGAYLGNMLVSLWYNIGVLKQTFDINKLKKSALKILCFGGGIGLTAIVISILPIFADSVGFAISEEFTESFQIIAVIGMFLTASCVYVAETLVKAKTILLPKSTTTNK